MLNEFVWKLLKPFLTPDRIISMAAELIAKWWSDKNGERFTAENIHRGLVKVPYSEYTPWEKTATAEEVAELVDAIEAHLKLQSTLPTWAPLLQRLRNLNTLDELKPNLRLDKK